MVRVVSLDELGRCNLDEWCLLGMVWASIQEYNSNATVYQVNHHGLVLFEVLDGVAFFVYDVISWWLGLVDS